MTRLRTYMPLRSKLAAILYVMDGIISIGLGAIYLFRGSFMPYHAEALSRSWDDVEPALQSLIVALMNVAGAGWIALGVATLVLVALPVRRGERWARVLVPMLLLLFYIPTLLATLTVLRETPGSPPWFGNAVACLMAVAAFLLDAPWGRQSESWSST